MADGLLWNSFGNSLIFLICAVPLRVGIALFLAILLNRRKTPFKGFLRTLFFLPVVTTGAIIGVVRSEEHTSELQSRGQLVCRLLLEKKKEATSSSRWRVASRRRPTRWATTPSAGVLAAEPGE